MNDVNDQLAAVAAASSALAEEIYSSIGRVGAHLTELWASRLADGTPPASGDLEALRPTVTRELDEHRSLFNGAGVVIAHGMLENAERYLEWWRPDGAGAEARRLTLDLDPRSEYFYDYTGMDWFSIPRDHDEKWSYGPYLDFTGVDLYVCTFAVPVRLRDTTFIGVAGADVPVTGIETTLFPLFRQLPFEAVLTNADGRVIVGNDPEHATGSKVKTPAISAQSVPHLPWTLMRLGS